MINYGYDRACSAPHSCLLPSGPGLDSRPFLEILRFLNLLTAALLRLWTVQKSLMVDLIHLILVRALLLSKDSNKNQKIGVIQIVTGLCSLINSYDRTVAASYSLASSEPGGRTGPK